MKHTQKVVGINLVILLIYTVFFSFYSNHTASKLGRGADYAIYMMLAVSLQAGICAIIAIVQFIRKNQTAKAFLISFLAIAMIGLSTCWGGAQLLN